MARRLRQQQLTLLGVTIGVPVVLLVLIFVGVPVVLVALAAKGCLFTSGNPAAYYEDAKKFAELKDWPQAWPAANRAASGSRDPEVHFLLAKVAMHQNPPAVSRAVLALQTTLSLKRDHVEAQRMLTELFLAMKWWPEAKKECEKMVALEPNNGRGYLWAAAIDMGMAGNEPSESKRGPYYEKAIEHCQQGIQKAPEMLELYRLMAAAYGRNGQLEKLDEVLDQAVAKNPGLGDAYIMKAGRLIEQGRLDDASALLKEAITKVPEAEDKKPERARLYVAVGEVELNRRNIDGAREAFRKAVELDPKSEASYLRLATMLRTDDKRDEALKILQQGLEHLPDSLLLKAEEADLILETPRSADADLIIDEIRKTAPPESPIIYYLMGKRALGQGRVREAITLLEQSRDRQSMPQTSLLLARAYIAADELGAAQRELDSLIKTMPGLITAWRMQAEVAIRLRDLELATKCAMVVLGNNANDLEMRLLVAQTLALSGRYEDAMREARSAADRAKGDPSTMDNPDPLLLIANIQMELKDPAKAEATLLEALAVSMIGGDSTQAPKPGRNTGRVYQRLLRFYSETKQTEKAKSLLEKAKKDLPNEQYIVILEADPTALERELIERTKKENATAADMMGLARYYQLTGQTDKAKEYIIKAMEKVTAGSPEWRQAWSQLFMLDLVTDESFKSAADLIADLKKVDPSAEELLLAEPLLAISQGRPNEAASSLRTLVKSKQGRSLSQAYYLLGQILIRQRQYDEAIAELGHALDLRPQLSQARLLRGRIYLRQGNLRGALREATEALKYDPHLVPALELKATASAGLGSWTDAVMAREEIRRVSPDNVANLATLAALYVSSHRNDLAMEAFKAAYAVAPDNLALVRVFAGFYAESGAVSEGKNLIEQYLANEKHAKEPGAWIVRGEFASKVGKLADAEPFYRKALELEPKNPSPLILLADEFAKFTDLNKAVSLYLEALKLAPESQEAKRHLADVYMLQGKLNEALKLVDEVLIAAPADASAMVVKARILSRLDRAREAVSLMEKALEAEPDYGEAKVRLAELYSGPDPEKAIKILEAVDPFDPAFEKAMLILSDIHARLSQLSESILDLKRLLDYRPVSRAGRMALASRYIANRDHAKAIDLLQEQVKQTQSQDAGLLVMLADEQSRASSFQEALSNYRKARLIKPDLPEALTGECKCLLALKMPKEAEELASQALNNPANKDAVWPRLALAAVYELCDKPEQAFDTIRNGLLQKTDWEDGYVYLANMLVRHNQTEDALKILQNGLNVNPNSIAIRASLATVEVTSQNPKAARDYLEPLAKQFDALYGSNDDNLGPERLDKLRPYLMPIRIYSLTLYNMGQVDDSLKWGMKLWHIDPTDIANANNMAWIWAVNKKDYKQARELIQRCKRLVPNHPQVLDTAGWIEFLDGHYKEAEENFKSSIKYGDNAEAHYHLGRLYEAMERPEDAQAEYQQALRMGLQGDDRRDAEERLKKMKTP
jgi:tetratricopeptide (TPR) repeat protein